MDTPLKLLITAYDYRPSHGGVASCAWEIARALSRTPGVEVRLLARKPLAHSPAQAAFSDDHGFFETVRVPMSQASWQAALEMGTALSREIVAWKPHAVLNLLWLPSGVASFISGPVRMATRTPYFMMVHGVEVMESRNTFKKRLRASLAPVKKMVFGGSSGIFAVSQFTKSLVVNTCGVHESKVKVVNNGVNTEEFFPETPAPDLIARYGLQGKRVFVTISRLEYYKGMDKTIAAMKQVIRRFPDAVYMICGEGPDRRRLERLARHYRVAQNVIFTGGIPFERRRDYYNLAECFVLLSRKDEEKPNVEGFGIVFLEAAACAKPSIGGRSGGISDAVLEGETGWLVNPTDENDAARAMIECLAAPDRARKMGANGLKRATEEMSWTHAAGKILDEVKRHVRD